MLRYAAAQTKAPAGIKLATMFTDRPNEDDLTTLRHAGVEAVSIWTTIENNSAEWMIAMRNKLEANGIEVYNIGILDLHCDPALVLSLPEAAAKIEQYKTYLGNLGRAGIHYTTYAHMSNITSRSAFITLYISRNPLSTKVSRNFGSGELTLRKCTLKILLFAPKAITASTGSLPKACLPPSPHVPMHRHTPKLSLPAIWNARS